jgi:hypothetical protein
LFIGYPGVAPADFRLLFLKRIGSSYEFTDPYYPSLPAVPGNPVSGGSDLDRVANAVAGALRSVAAPINTRLEAARVLAVTPSHLSTGALGEQYAQPDLRLRLTSIASGLQRGDLAAIQEADTIFRTPQSVPADLLQNLWGALGSSSVDPSAIGAVARLLDGPTVEVRRAAASVLRPLHSAVPLPVFSRMLEDPDREVQYYAVIALGEMTREAAWSPGVELFKSDPQPYLTHWREWIRIH